MAKRKADPEQIEDLDTNDYIQNDAANSHNPTSVPDPDDIESRIDPRLLDTADRVGQIVADVDGAAVMNDELEEVVLNQLRAPLEIPSALMVPGVAFVDFFSCINVISNKRLASSKSKGIPDTFRGNGRDEPTLFQHKCRKTPGCKYYSDNRYHLLVHEGRCSAERMEKIDSADRTHWCPVEHCGASFESTFGLKFHRETVHEYKPHPCKVGSCDPNILYESRNAYRKHQRAEHPSWTPKKCPIDGCTSDVNFKTAQALKAHIQVIHKIEDKDLLKSHTYVRTLGYKPQRCSYPECEHTTVFQEKRGLFKHLQNRHNIAKDDAETYIISE